MTFTSHLKSLEYFWNKGREGVIFQSTSLLLNLFPCLIWGDMLVELVDDISACELSLSDYDYTWEVSCGAHLYQIGKKVQKLPPMIWEQFI